MATIIQESTTVQQMDYKLNDMIRGDNRIITLNFTQKDATGKVVPYTGGGYCLLTVKENMTLADTLALMRVKADINTTTGICQIIITPEHTSKLTYTHNYYYDIQKVLLGTTTNNVTTPDSVKTIVMGRWKIVADVGQGYKV